MAEAVVERVAQRRPIGAAAAAVGQYRDYLAERLGLVRPSLLY